MKIMSTRTRIFTVTCTKCGKLVKALTEKQVIANFKEHYRTHEVKE